jgi:putative peptide zinc metalloprotease protein
MDIPRPEILKQLQLTLSAEGRRLGFFLSDLASGKVVSVPRDAALGLQRIQDRIDGHEGAEVERPELEAGLRALNYVRAVRRADRAKAARFNPLFIQINLFDVGPWQPGLRRFSQWFVGWPLAVVSIALLLCVLVLGIRNDWSIRAEFSGVLQIETLLAFGLLAPFLKIIHEFGHVVAATAMNVRVRNAAISLIALYPLPTVDCSEADVSASPRGRMTISLAGIVTDFLMGALAFIIWHVAESDVTRGVAGQVLVFSTLNSLLFNANPLMKLDGYYALVDLVGQRNLYTRGSSALSEMTRWLLSLGATGSLPRRSGTGGLVIYGAAAFIYRLIISFTIITAILPQYLGLGLVLGAWGVYVMFISPLLADRPQRPATTTPKWRLWAGRGGFAALGLAIVLFVPLPFSLWLPLRLDDSGHYAITVASSGFVLETPATRQRTTAGDALLRLTNPENDRQGVLLGLEQREAALLQQSTQSIGLGEAQLAQEKMRSVEAQIAVLETERQGLTVTSPADGIFLQVSGLQQGRYLVAGDTVGHLYPDTGISRLVGDFPERWVQEFQTHPPTAELRLGNSYFMVASDALHLIDGSITDPVTGLRAIRLHVGVDQRPADLVGQDVQVRLNFGNRPILDHLAFWANGKIAAFRDAQIADRASRIGQEN